MRNDQMGETNGYSFSLVKVACLTNRENKQRKPIYLIHRVAVIRYDTQTPPFSSPKGNPNKWFLISYLYKGS